MVTHNPELAEEYSTRIVKVLDGEILDDSNPFDGKEEKKEEKIRKSKKSKMNFKTAFSLSLNNLMTKKGRTILTAFAGSIGIIGIALILSLSNGIQNYITKTEEETLSSYPLMIKKDSVEMSTMLNALMGDGSKNQYDDDLIHANNIMGNMFSSIKVEKNDLKSLKEYFESDETKIKEYVSDIRYGYDISLHLYKNDANKVIKVNPTTIMDAIGMPTTGISSVYSDMTGNYDVFLELMDNQALNEQQYDVVAGRWPKAYNEVVLVVNKNNEISDYTLYSLGLLNQEDLKKQFSQMTEGKEVHFEQTAYTTEELLKLSFKLVSNTDFYVKSNGIWLDKSNDEDYMKKVLEEADEIKVVGIIKANEEAVGNENNMGFVYYTHALWEHLIQKINSSSIVKEQLENPKKNIFTGLEFSETLSEFNLNSLTKEQLAALKNLSSEELAVYKESMNASYEGNLKKLGVANLDDPDSIYIYPKDFDSKEEITKIIDSYNAGKSEGEQIKYTDMVGIMMSSVSTIVNVISSVLIAFVAISLIVSSIMIAIITYISVIERTKEIGILRAIGASKRDISRVFNAETLIEGLTAGVLGIVVTFLLTIPINAIIKSALNISNIAKLPFVGAIVLILISVILTVVAGFIPAKIASKKDPVEALRTE